MRRSLIATLTLLVLLPSGCALAGRSLTGYVDDKLMKSGVKRRLSSELPGDPGVRVDTFGGTVYLSGIVDTAGDKADAERAAWEVEGVQQVVNDLVALDAALSASPSTMPDFRPRHPLLDQLPGVERVEPGPPGGPELAYDHAGRVVASVYTIGWRALIDSGLATLEPAGGPVHQVSTYVLPEDPDRPGPAYVIVLWHVSPHDAALR